MVSSKRKAKEKKKNKKRGEKCYKAHPSTSNPTSAFPEYAFSL